MAMTTAMEAAATVVTAVMGVAMKSTTMIRTTAADTVAVIPQRREGGLRW